MFPQKIFHQLWYNQTIFAQSDGVDDCTTRKGLLLDQRSPPPSVWKKDDTFSVDNMFLDTIIWTIVSSFTQLSIVVADGDDLAIFQDKSSLQSNYEF